MKCFEVIISNDSLVAVQDVPDVSDPVGCAFFKNKTYKIKEFRGDWVDMYGDYDTVDSFSLQPKFKGTNYLWDWFRKA
jgi:hypothetical protein